MKRTLGPLLGALVLLLAFGGHDDPFPKDVFRSPLDVPLTLAGNFAEMRSNHFHAGLDLKTGNRIGLPVHAAADGWVSRIKVSPTGYGLALYVDHPGGYTTVYGHLSRFADTLATYVKRLQYRERSFAVDTHPPKGRFPVKQGEVIAFTGNTGSSGGPHLHFEIRDAATEEPLNPLLFGLPVKDTLPPKIFRLKVYAAKDGSFARIERRGGRPPLLVRPGAPATLRVTRVNGTYRLRDVRSIRAHGRIGFGIQTHDYHDGSNNRLGVFRIRLEADDETLFRSEIDRFSFAQTRYINAHVDYAEHERSRRWIQRSFLLPGNRLPFYRTENRGFLNVSEGERHRLTYTVEDAAGNRARLAFDVEGAAARPVKVDDASAYAAVIPRARAAVFEREGLRVSFPAYALYEDLELRYRVLPPEEGAYSNLHAVHDAFTPVHKSLTLDVRADALPKDLRHRALIARVDPDGDVSSVGGSYRNGFIEARVRSFGTFFVTVDTLAPEIRPLNIRAGKSMRGLPGIRLRIKDDLAGIASYVGYIDGEWALFAYDAKTGTLVHTFDGRVGAGPHTLSMIVTDRVGNVARYEAAFTR
ncbi:M23 family metallopeptidase [Rhodocaloribacter sp.]